MSGTARGQGRAATLRFAAEGAIVVGDLRHESALVTRRLVAQAGGTAVVPGRLDVTDEDSVRAWVEEAADAFGASTSSAPPGAVCFGAVDTQPYEDFGFTMRRAGLGGAGRVRRPAPPGAQSRLHSHCGVHSGPARFAHPSADRHSPALGFARPGSAPMASKGAVIAMPRQLASEGAPYGIRANCVSPVIDAEATRGDQQDDDPSHADHRPKHPPPPRRTSPGGRQAAVFLASDEASCTTGATPVDGGRSSVLPG
ncbi:SDR family oxidoreductase [Streptomyces collinus]|uniref:SDR family oxidoreductase n=1 Tax=Streptomyces collinus TaxID=42684 RepID=UPI0034109348